MIKTAVNLDSLRAIVDERCAPVFNFLSGVHNSQPLSVDRLITATRKKIQRNDIVQVLKQLDSLNIGCFAIGRRGIPSHFVWYFHPESVGKVALGKARVLRPVTIEIAGQIAPKQDAAPRVPTIPPQRADRAFSVTRSAGALFIALPSNVSAQDANRLARVARKQYKEAS